jgi:hypothetical protein
VHCVSKETGVLLARHALRMSVSHPHPSAHHFIIVSVCTINVLFLLFFCSLLPITGTAVAVNRRIMLLENIRGGGVWLHHSQHDGKQLLEVQC